jgi:hypothetical protein
MNNSGFIGFKIIFFDIVFITVWIFALAPFINIMGQNALDSGNINGLMAFAFTNLNLLILIGLILANVLMAFAGNNQA